MGDLAVLRTHYGIEKLSKPKSKITDKFIGIIPSTWACPDFKLDYQHS